MVMSQMRANSFSEFVHFTDLLDLVYGLYIFRGQALQGNLIPGIARKNPAIDTTELEGKL